MAVQSARADELRGEVAAHKAAIRRHRSDLAKAKAALEAELARFGIRLIVEGEGEETTHGRDRQVRTRP